MQNLRGRTPSTSRSKASPRNAGTGTASRRRRGEPGRPHAHRARRGCRRPAPALRLCLLPAIRAGLLRRLPPHRADDARPGRVPRRLHLRIVLGPRPRAQARRRGAVHARGLPRAPRALQVRPRICRRRTRPVRGSSPGTTTKSTTTTPTTGPRTAWSARRFSRAAPPRTAPITSTCRCRSACGPKGPTCASTRTSTGAALARFHILDDAPVPLLAGLPAPRPARRLEHRRHRALRAPAASRAHACSAARRSAGSSSALGESSAALERARAAPRRWRSSTSKPGPGRRAWTDGWDGYPAARQRLFDSMISTKARKPGGASAATSIPSTSTSSSSTSTIPTRPWWRASSSAPRSPRRPGRRSASNQLPARQPAHAAGRQPLSAATCASMSRPRRFAGRPARDGKRANARCRAAARSRRSSWRTASRARSAPN